TPAWQAGAALAERLGDVPQAAFFLESLARRLPDDREVLRRYALALARSAPAARAQPALRRAVEAFPGDARLWELLARARIEQRAFAEAHELARRSLHLDPNNVTLWWIAADLARDLGNLPAEREALRAALDREPDRADRRARLVALALEAGDGPQARKALEEAEGKTPDDVAILEAYAAGWERLGEPERALQLWFRSVQVDGRFERGYVAAARLLGAAGDWERSLTTALRGLERLPDSAPLHLAHAQALRELGRLQKARKAIRSASRAVPDPSLAKLGAEIEELFGGPDATAAWGRYLELLEGADAAEEERRRARTRAIFTALRDGQLEAAVRWMGITDRDAVQGQHQPGESITIPGGVKVLQFLSNIGGPTDPAEYLVTFSRAIVQRSEAMASEQWKRQTEPLLEHYERLAQLRALFPPSAEGTTVALETASKAGAQRTRKVLELLGYRLRVSRGRVSIEPRMDKDRAQRQALAAALEWDERAAAASLQAGRPFVFRLVDDAAPVVLGERAWAEWLQRYRNP
ncbi:MAG: tetratricopeptide repeat protein, partial [Bryobacteraceae bacterium]|nr:tetratricopeptide repeat protein [Bryobacteraceae bacterium]